MCVCVRVNLSDKTLRPSCLVFVQHFCLEHRDKKKKRGRQLECLVDDAGKTKEKKKKESIFFNRSFVNGSVITSACTAMCDFPSGFVARQSINLFSLFAIDIAPL